MSLTKQAGKTRFLDAACHPSERESLLAFIKTYQAGNHKRVSGATVLAVYLIEDLYSDSSTDSANANRITMNLEAAAEDLLSISRLIKTLA